MICPLQGIGAGTASESLAILRILPDNLNDYESPAAYHPHGGSGQQIGGGP